MVVFAAFAQFAGNLCHAGDIKLLTYNVAAIPVVHGRVRHRMLKIAKILEEKKYAVAAFQECWVQECSTLLRAPFASAVRYVDGILGGDGLLLGTALPVIDTKHITFSINAPMHRFLYGEADGIASKGVVAATLQTEHGPLKVFNTHFIAGYRGRDYVPERAAQVYELASFIREYAGGDPYVLLGDLNLTPASPEYAMLTGLLDLRDTCAGCLGSDMARPDRRIDHIFVSSEMAGWTVSYSGITFDEPLSDHKAVEIVLRSPAKGAATPRRPEAALTRSRALLAVINSMDQFITETARSIRLNMAIPFYGWSHARWGNRQIRSAGRIQSRALAELQNLERRRKSGKRKE